MTGVVFTKRLTLGRTLLACALLTLLASGVRSAEDGFGTELMQSIEDSNKSLASNIALKEAKGANADAKELADMFAKVQTYYAQKGDAADAVELARKCHDLTLKIQSSVTANDYSTATGAATDLSRTCKTCHNFYKKS